MSVLQLMRPAARSAAMRPHSSFLPSPWPVSAASLCSASLFFAPAPRPVGKQSYWVAVLCSQFDWEHGRGWERFWEHEKRPNSVAYAIVPTVPTPARARVMCSRARALGLMSLSLGTWEQCLVIELDQALTLFPSLFPAARRVGTWEHPKASARLRDWLCGAANKLEVGYGHPRLQAGDARRKFRAPNALELGRGLVDQAQLRSDPQNGGNRPFPLRPIGHVGRAMLEGRAQAADPASFSVPCRKLGRLRGRALGELAGLFVARAPRAPNRGRRSSAMLAMDAGGIWIETRSGPIDVQAGSIHDWAIRTVEEKAQNDTSRRGPGGADLSIAAGTAGRAHSRRVWKRAGVNFSPAVARPHEAGGNRTLGRRNETVKGLAA